MKNDYLYVTFLQNTSNYILQFKSFYFKNNDPTLRSLDAVVMENKYSLLHRSLFHDFRKELKVRTASYETLITNDNLTISMKMMSLWEDKTYLCYTHLIFFRTGNIGSTGQSAANSLAVKVMLVKAFEKIRSKAL